MSLVIAELVMDPDDPLKDVFRVAEINNSTIWRRLWVRQFYIRSGKAHPPAHIEICAGGWNAGDGLTGKQDVELFFSGALSKALSMQECIEAMKDAFVPLSKGEADVPLRTNLPMLNENGGALFMPVYLPNIRKVGLKAVTVYKDNPKKGLPMIQVMVMVFDASTGSPLAV